jgi:hypothetical protein
VRIFNGITVLLLILTLVGGCPGPLVVPAPTADAVTTPRRRPARFGPHPAGGGLVQLHPCQHGTASQQERPTGHPHALFHAYFSISRWLLIGLIVVFVVALITGPRKWAGSLRRIVSRYAREG